MADKKDKIPFTSIPVNWIEWLFLGKEDGGTLSTPNNLKSDEKRNAPSTSTLKYCTVMRLLSSNFISLTRSMMRLLAESNYFFDTQMYNFLTKEAASKFLGLIL